MSDATYRDHDGYKELRARARGFDRKARVTCSLTQFGWVASVIARDKTVRIYARATTLDTAIDAVLGALEAYNV